MIGRVKKICAMVLVLALVGLNVSADNLMINGDFEGIGGSLYNAADSTKVAGWNFAVTNLDTDAVTGNHYFTNNSGAATSVNTNSVVFPPAIDRTKVYKLSMDYRHPSNTKLQFRFNAGNSTYDWSFVNDRAPGTNQWHNHSMFLYNFFNSSNADRIGGYTGSYLAGAWSVDNVKFEEVQNEVVFAKNMDTFGIWATKANAGNVGNNGSNTLSYKTERFDQITSLSGANVNAETGVRTLSAQVHYLSSAAGEAVQALSAVYKEVDGKKALVEVNISDEAVTVVPMTSVNAGNITVPAAESGVKYSVKVMLWNSLGAMSPVMEDSTISD